MSVADRFAAFFAAANRGVSPYPWQVALAEQVADTGRWPDISAPTGAGKSSVIDVHVFLVAEHAAGRLDVRPPRRLVMVAPRRVLVDDQYERAAALARLLETDGTAGPLTAIAGTLRRLMTSEPGTDANPPMAVWRLRGGVALDNGWRLEPAACQVICATPQMWGSRVLLRGFGASPASRNLEAGLLGQDTVVVIDEAHLHERLVDTARNVAGRSPAEMGLQVVAMSATRPPASGQIGLTAADVADADLARRVEASKRVELVPVAEWAAAGLMTVVVKAQEQRSAGTVGVFVNDVPAALRVAGELAKDGSVVELVCGRLRPADLSRLRSRRPGLLTQAGDPKVEFLVSTQSLEVGVDLDLSAMVTMLAPAAALAQRAGRLNRSGRRADATFVVVMPEELTVETAPRGLGPYDAERLVAAVGWLDRLGGSISPGDVARCPLPVHQEPLLPALRAPDLETLAQTSDRQSADPDVELYLQVPTELAAEVEIAARRFLDLDAEVVEQALIACPPRPHEVATMRLGDPLRRVLTVALAGAVAPWVLRRVDGILEANLITDSDAVRPGDTVVIAHAASVCTAGVIGVERGLGTIGALDEVLADAPAGAAEDHVLPLECAVIEPLIAADRMLARRATRNSLADLLEASGFTALAVRMRRHRRLSELELHWCGGEAHTGLLVVRDRRLSADLLISAAGEEPVTLEVHQRAVADRLERILEVLAPDELGVNATTMSQAARMHDEGKRHPRFQRRMGADEVPLAKPAPGHVPDRGDGWRHEQLSAAYAAAATDDDSMVVTLIAAHHGRGRPLFDRDLDGLLDGWADVPPEVHGAADRLYGLSGRYELLRSRVQRDLGVHRLALLEALLRCADIQVSREGS